MSESFAMRRLQAPRSTRRSEDLPNYRTPRGPFGPCRKRMSNEGVPNQILPQAVTGSVSSGRQKG